MRRLKYVLLLLAIAIVGAVPIARGTATANDPRVPGLVRQVNTLKKQVAALTAKSNCIGIQGVLERGNPSAQDGYLYKKAGDTTNVYITQSLDITAQGEQPQALMAVIDPRCVGTNAAFRLTQPLGHRATPHSAAR